MEYPHPDVLDVFSPEGGLIDTFVLDLDLKYIAVDGKYLVGVAFDEFRVPTLHLYDLSDIVPW